MGGVNYSSDHQSDRLALLERDPYCVHCGAVATVADHQPPISLHDHVRGTGCCSLVASCATCSSKQGAQLSQEGTTEVVSHTIERTFDTAETVPMSDERWQVPWLVELLEEMPDDAGWPRMMTLPHPDAVGSYGEEVEAVAAEQGMELRWWQRLMVTRILEHDAEGNMCWLTTVLTTPRQVGKSIGLRHLAMWRLRQAERFSEVQLVLHTGHQLGIVQEIQRPALLWARKQPDEEWKVRESGGEHTVIWVPDDGRWMCKSMKAAYGMTSTTAMVDEAWGVPPSAVSEGLEPVLVENLSGQLLLVSTAHRLATSLMPSRRKTAIAEITEPIDTLLMEWSAPPTADLDDREAWRAASPHWHPRRERMMAQRLEQARSGDAIDLTDPEAGIEAFRTQWLNIWPGRSKLVELGEPLLEGGTWASCLKVVAPEGGAVFAVEDWFGNGSAVAWAGLAPDGRTVVGGTLFERRSQAYDFLAEHTEHVISIVAGGSIAGDADLRAISASVHPSGTKQTKAGLARLREITKGQLWHDGSPDLAGQVEVCRVKETTTGLAIASRDRSDCLRAMLWAVGRFETERAGMPQIY